MSPDKIAWGPTPPGLPPGAQAAILLGDPDKEGPFVVRVKAPAGYIVPPHHHSKDETVTVLSGKTGMAMGETVEKDASKTLVPGGFAYMPAGMVHYAWSAEESVIQISGNGPFDIIYANPKDDPRKQQGAK
jgi:quercetin dioxygenase-like cupin family protein